VERSNLPTREEIEDELRRARRVRQIVDFTCAMIAQGQLPRRDAEQLVQAARERILDLFPGSEQTYEIVCAPRFRRMLEEFTPDPGSRRGGVLAFRSRSSEH
jgi:hypothetical protein